MSTNGDMRPLSSVAEVRAAEDAAIASGTSAATLTRRAGTSFAELVHASAGNAGLALFLVGPGNNGADGLVAAARLTQLGWRCRLWFYRHDGDAQAPVDPLPSARDGKVETGPELDTALADADVVIDAVFGLGARPGLRDDLAEILRRVRAAQLSRSLPVWALDVPTGVDLDSGQVDPAAITADATGMLGLPKAGLYRSPALRQAGRLWLIDIGLPDPPLADQPGILTPAGLRRLLPRRRRDAHKHDVGRLLVLGGADTYYGAPRLAASAAMRAGAGLVTVAVPERLVAVLAAALAEATFLPLPDGDAVADVTSAAAAVSVAGARSEAWLIGPGLGRGARVEALLDSLLFGNSGKGAYGGRAVIDADGLNWLAAQPEWWERLAGARLVLTPHAGELGRLLGEPRAVIEAEPWNSARRAAERFGQVVLLKQAFPAVAFPGRCLVLGPQSEPALATAGSGDVLAGTIAGLLAQGLEPWEAAVAGLYIAACAGERARRRCGTLGLVASDVIEALPATLRWFYDPKWRKDDEGWHSTWTWPAL